jgi:DNA-binding winged helix-turn-helix (wHTH) protein
MILTAMTQRLAFGRFVLDLARGSLHSGDREVPLRPETRAVLAFLAARPDRFVSHEELRAAAPGSITSDAALAQIVDELRRALADDAARLIVTVPHGYRFVPAAAPGERRKARGWHPLRWRWIYGILAPLLLALTVVVLLLLNHEKPVPARTEIPVTAR